jgi:hypothetical protein
MFKSRKSGKRCFICDPMKSPKLDCLNIEHKSFLLLEPYIKDHFDFVRCCESCKCDYIVKPKSVSEDKWIPLQLKSTETKVFNQYKFDIKDKYTIEAILCICIDEERYWLFDKAPDVTRINIGISKTRGKYIKNEVSKDKLKDELMKLYETSESYSKEFLNKPSTPEVALEIEYKKIRAESVKCLKFEEPDRNQLHYDFLVNKLRVQEKTASVLKKGKGRNSSKYSYNFAVTKRKGKKGCIPYHKHDNDFYWFNPKDTGFFFVIPSEIMFEKGYLQDDNIGKDRKTSIYFNISNKSEWYNDYKFSYTDVDQTKLKTMFGL